MLEYVLIGLAVLILLAILFIASQPSAFSVSRSTTFAASPSAVFPHVNDFHNWKEWSPWAKLDPTATETYEGTESGVGAIMSWNGNKKVGAGKMTILESQPSERVGINLEFFRPMKATNRTEFTFKPEGKQTAVNWTMTGTNGFVGKAFWLILNCDKMVGGDFEKGLASMKAIVEKP